MAAFQPSPRRDLLTQMSCFAKHVCQNHANHRKEYAGDTRTNYFCTSRIQGPGAVAANIWSQVRPSPGQSYEVGNQLLACCRLQAKILGLIPFGSRFSRPPHGQQTVHKVKNFLKSHPWPIENVSFLQQPTGNNTNPLPLMHNAVAPQKASGIFGIGREAGSRGSSLVGDGTGIAARQFAQTGI